MKQFLKIVVLILILAIMFINVQKIFLKIYLKKNYYLYIKKEAHPMRFFLMNCLAVPVIVFALLFGKVSAKGPRV